MDRLKSAIDNETPKILWDFVIQTDRLIPAWRPDLSDNFKKLKTCPLVDFNFTANHRNQRKRKERQVFGPWQRTEKTAEHEDNGDTNCNWCTRNGSKRLVRKTGGIRHQRKIRNHPDYCIIEISQNTAKSPRDLRKLTVTQTPAKDWLPANYDSKNLKDVI